VETKKNIGSAINGSSPQAYNYFWRFKNSLCDDVIDPVGDVDEFLFMPGPSSTSSKQENVIRMKDMVGDVDEVQFVPGPSSPSLHSLTRRSKRKRAKITQGIVGLDDVVETLPNPSFTSSKQENAIPLNDFDEDDVDVQNFSGHLFTSLRSSKRLHAQIRVDYTGMCEISNGSHDEESVEEHRKGEDEMDDEIEEDDE